MRVKSVWQRGSNVVTMTRTPETGGDKVTSGHGMLPSLDFHLFPTHHCSLLRASLGTLFLIQPNKQFEYCLNLDSWGP